MDRDGARFQGAARFVKGDLNGDFDCLFNGNRYALVTALEVIEHLENPSHFLRQCASLLAPGGALVITTPNIESMPARIKFLLQGRMRHFDGNGDRTHITPIDAFLLERLAARAGLKVCHRIGLVRQWHDGRLLFRALAAALAPLVKGSPYGACHLFVLQPEAGLGRAEVKTLADVA